MDESELWRGATKVRLGCHGENTKRQSRMLGIASSYLIDEGFHYQLAMNEGAARGRIVEYHGSASIVIVMELL